MKFTGEFTVNGAPDEVFARLNDARFFAACLDGVSDLVEIDPTHYTARLETRIAFIKFTFEVAVEIVESDPPTRVVAKAEGTPVGVVGRLVSVATARLEPDDGGTKVLYDMDVTLAGKLGAIGQPVLRAKAKEMEKSFVAKARAAFAGGAGTTR